jgi:hypothetical protein
MTSIKWMIDKKITPEKYTSMYCNNNINSNFMEITITKLHGSFIKTTIEPRILPSESTTTNASDDTNTNSNDETSTLGSKCFKWN